LILRPYSVAALVVIACLGGGTTLAAAYDHVLPSRYDEANFTCHAI